MSMAFSLEEYGERMWRAQDAIAAAGLDGLVLTTPENISYLSGYWTPGYHVFQAMFVPREGEPFLVVRNIELDNVATRSWVKAAYAVASLDHPLDTFRDVVREKGCDRGTIGLEVDGARQSMLRPDLLADLLPGASWVPSLGVVDALRAVKSDAEIDYIRRAVKMAEAALVAGAKSLADAVTDSDVAAAVHGELAAAGSEFTGSPPYVVGGAASARTHAVHAGRPLSPQEPVWLEVSASVERYHGVASRIAGTQALSAEARRLSDISAEILKALIGRMRDGATSGDVDAVGRAVAARHGVTDNWKNRAAYSLGLSFPPGLGEGHIIDIKPSDQRVLRAGMVFHLIPILKVPGVGAVGCTDTVLVTEDGGERLGRLDLVPLTPEVID